KKDENHSGGGARHALSKEFSDPLDERRRLFESSPAPGQRCDSPSPPSTAEPHNRGPRKKDERQRDHGASAPLAVRLLGGHARSRPLCAQCPHPSRPP